MKSILIKSLKYLFKTILIFTAVVFIYLAFALLLPYIKVNMAANDSPKKIEIFVLSNGVHTDLVLPKINEYKNWASVFPHSDFEKVDSTFNYVAMGWGDKGFYLETPTWADLKVSTALKAAFGLSTSAMHITYRRYRPNENDLCKSIFISEKQYQLLIQYIESSFQFRNYKVIKISHTGYNKCDCFYEANGCYSMFKTCNVWTGNALKKANIKVGIWTPFHQGVLGSVE